MGLGRRGGSGVFVEEVVVGRGSWFRYKGW